MIEGVENPNSAAYWYPILKRSGVPTPETRIVRTKVNLTALLDGKTPAGFTLFINKLADAAKQIGAYPIFLRTAYGSAKHEWRHTCYVPDREALPRHVAGIVEWSNIVDIFGLPTDVWLVRKFLRLRATFHAFADMPVAREFRIFIKDGAVQCFHPYWPAESIRRPETPDWRPRLQRLSELDLAETTILLDRAKRVAAVFAGAWSLDMAQDVDHHWWAIDMAQADRSYHWPICQYAPST